MPEAKRLFRPDVLFLDVGDTLIRPQPSWSGLYIEALRGQGIDVTEEQLDRAFASATTSEHRSFEGPFATTEHESWQRIVAFDQLVLDQLGHHRQPESVFRAIEGRFSVAGSWHVFPDVLPALDALREAGIRMAVISNWTWTAVELLHELDLAAHFEAFAISARVGYQKPHAGIFRHALELTGAAPERAIHVGDQYRADVLGARSVGITPVLLERRGRDHETIGVPEEDRTNVPFIRDLLGLLELLEVPVPAGAPRS
ncbi:MAG: HAD-IA family hydrolase [Chloroflexi bacterium]|nr:HAD-IA family hydrolase [Chloroflexota bacterium]